MRIRTLIELSEFLDSELAWRKKELTTLRFMLGKSRPHERMLLLRAGICLLYAHWEGFIKAAATSYLSFVASRNLRYRDLTPNFVAIGLREQIRQAGQSNLPSLRTELITRLTAGLSDTATLGWENAFETRGNLNSKVLNEVFFLLGLDGKAYSPKGALLDHRLLANRNLVAHGERPEIDPVDYNDLHSEIIQLVDWFRTDIENAAVTSAYRRRDDIQSSQTLSDELEP